MKRLSFLLVGILILITNVYSQDAIIEDKNSVVSKESENTTPEFSLRDNINIINETYTIQNGKVYDRISNIPFLNTDRTISFNKYHNSKKLRKLDSKYIKLMRAVVTAKNKHDLDKANKKALDFFEDISHNSSSKDAITLANYQLGHYYAFSIFDPFFDGYRPSNIERKRLYPIDKHKADKYFNKIIIPYEGAIGLIRLIPDTWYFDIERGLASIIRLDYKEIINVIKYLDENNYNFNIQKTCKYSCDFCDYCNTKSIYPLEMITLLYAIEQLPMTSLIRKQLALDLNSDEIVALALSYDKQDKTYEAFFYGALATVRGNANGYLIFFDKWSNSILSHYKNEHKVEYKAGLAHLIIPMRLWPIKPYIKECNLKNFDEISNNIDEYYNNIADEMYSDYTSNIKAQKREQRKRFWRQLGLAFSNTLQQSVKISTLYTQPNYTNVGNFNSLIDPKLAAMQVNAQYYAEYQDFCLYNKKANGSNYTYSEWLTLRGQAIMNLKGQGYDPIAEQKKINEQQKTDFAEQRKNDKKAWFAKYGYDTTSESSRDAEKTLTTDNTSLISSGTKSSNSNIIATENIDSKEQYKSNEVSSDDYHFEKHVTLYIRDANSNRIMFSNKDLCKKGAKYYVKIDNKYYLVNTQGGWGFNSSIIYSNTKLYFDN